MRADGERIGELERLLPELEAGEAAEADAVRSRQQARAELDARAVVLAGRRRDLDVRAAGLDERAQFLQDRLADIERRLAADAAARGCRRAAPDRGRTLAARPRSARRARRGPPDGASTPTTAS